jgi:hypothetical protein
MYRQGDVLIIPVAGIPDDSEPIARENGRIILAHGEVTGHPTRSRLMVRRYFAIRSLWLCL